MNAVGDSARAQRLLPEIACLVDSAGRIAFAHSNFEAALGWPVAQLVGKPLVTIVRDDDAAATEAWLQRLFAGERDVPSLVNRVRAHNGSWQRVCWSGVRPHDSLYLLSGRIAALGEATGPAPGSAPLVDYRALFECIPECVLIADTAGTVVLANPGVELVFGHAPEAVLGMPLAQLVPAAAEWGSGGISGSEIEVEGRHRLGHAIALELSCDAWISHARELLVVVVRENSERKRLIGDLTAARVRAEQANRAKSAFLAAMSHELRTPMNGVIGMLEVLSHITVDPAQQELLETIGESATALLGLLDDVLDFSKIEADRIELERARLSPLQLAEGVCETLAENARAAGVHLHLFVDPASPPLVIADPLRLRQVLLNLAGNAVKFSGNRPGQPGRVAIRLRVSAEPAPQLVMVVVDNGIGIAADVSQRLFQPFMQAEASTTRRYGGTGLGLAICKRLVDLMGGTIQVASTPGFGSAFTVSVPVSVVPFEPAPEPPPLADVECVVIPGGMIDGNDIRQYLEHAGAAVTTGSLDAVEGQGGPLVVVQGLAAAESWNDVVAAVAAQAPDSRHVLVTRGRRRRPREVAPNVFTVDGDVLRRTALVEAVALAAGVRSGEAAGARSRRPTPAPRDNAATAAMAPILVAEDDRVNQKVVRRQLELLGYPAEIVANGAEALAAWRRKPYSLLLTDLHMPQLDGYALAAAIRGEEGAGQRLPILALTANALHGEANRALDAGMDAYLTKPIRLQELDVALTRWIPRQGDGSEPHHDAAADGAAGGAPPVLDVEVLRRLVGDDPATIVSLLEDYRTAAGATAAEMRSALEAGNLAGVAALAHRIKSSSRAVGAAQLAELSVVLEREAAAGGRPAVDAALRRFDAAVRAVDGELARQLAAGPERPAAG
jgi:PAS domain S-box-containing protein